jgi:hypothetical protein
MLYCTMSHASDYFFCKDALSKIEQAAHDATMTVDHAKVASENYEMAKTGLQGCIDMQPTMGNCDSYSDKYKIAKAVFETAQSEVRLAISQLNDAIKNASESCSEM